MCQVKWTNGTCATESGGTAPPSPPARGASGEGFEKAGLRWPSETARKTKPRIRDPVARSTRKVNSAWPALEASGSQNPEASLGPG